MTSHRIGFGDITAGLAALTMLAAAGNLSAQPSQPTTPPGRRKPPTSFDNPMTAQMVDSRRGFIARIPNEAVLDSTASGWNPERNFERRVYRIPGAGEIRFTVTVKDTAPPDTAIEDGGYVFINHDSATAKGTAHSRTYLLDTRQVRIDIIPTSITMKKYIDAREEIFKSFRWKPKANTRVLDTDPPPMGSGQ